MCKEVGRRGQMEMGGQELVNTGGRQVSGGGSKMGRLDERKTRGNEKRGAKVGGRWWQ